MTKEIIFFFISTLGVFNSFAISIYFIFIKKRLSFHFKLAGLSIFLISIQPAIDCLYFFDNHIPEFTLKISLLANFCSTVITYILLSNDKNKLSTKSISHIISCLIIIVSTSALLLIPSKIDQWETGLKHIVFTILIIYLFKSGLLISSIYKHKPITCVRRLRFIIFGLLIGVFASYGIALISFTILSPISFTLISFIAIILYMQKHNIEESNAILKTPKVENSKNKWEKSHAENLIQNLKNYMANSKCYKDPNLKVSDVAKEINIQPYELSHLVNNYMGRNFINFINEYRINEAKILLDTQEHLTVEGIGYECGFNSKSTFFTTFKSNTNLTPSKYKKRNKKVRISKEELLIAK
ncbi:helix-turn-helix domain-containing protein [Aureibacter tunicatorum]|uniref:AraC-like DNA-binding protein n=1 Tax=Aureibacter tunicatorum TaxID=866807 RepID=A0AAE3XQR0_9BACT|nr:helix-turn-helix domain-containing protein [Aureibacter tunicatorum]MDR6241397.1 AraC-like DNA-binding protein [Aureibacter tunicatorum]BDD06758.1 hypothetical protein AUTU_42410 [Aureibacter tunicatorum]